MDTERYFDWAATSKPDMDIITSAAIKAASAWGNPSSLHQAGKAAHALLEKAREKAAACLGVKKDTVYFTSGGTESDHIALLSTLMRPQKGTVLVSGIEHPAIIEEAKVLSRCGVKIVSIPPNKDGIITPAAVMERLTADTLLVCVMAVNNETGAISPINEIGAALLSTKGRRIHFHSDCVQAAGKITLNLEGVSSAAFSAHKICGPRGIGALYIKEGTYIEPFLRGGGQEKGMRSGTENVAGAIAFAKCLERYSINKENTAMARYKEQCALTNEFIKQLCTIPSCTIIPETRAMAAEAASNGAASKADDAANKWSPWIVQSSFMGIPGQVMLRALDAMGYSISTGSACSSHKGTRTILDAMGVKDDVSKCAVRFSFGYSTTKQAMDSLLCAIQDVVSKLK